MRGEKSTSVSATSASKGSPPRARGEVFTGPLDFDTRWITPACAGRRSTAGVPGAANRDHPRVCGEKQRYAVIIQNTIGSPPRVRGEDCTSYNDATCIRITPACAGRRRW